MNRSFIAMLALALVGCAGKVEPIVSTPPAACSKLIPPGWQEGIDAAPVPQNTDISEWLGKPLTAAMAAAIVAPWATAYLLISGALEKANGRTADTSEIMTNCEALVNSARPKAR